MQINFFGDIKFVMRNTYRLVNVGSYNGPDTKYSGITRKLVQERMKTNLFSFPVVVVNRQMS
jgi:hypothetical protein